MNVTSVRGVIADGQGRSSRVMFVWISLVSDLLTALTSSGVTADRPTKLLFIGRTYFDTTLGIPIWHDGTNWVNSAGTTV